MTEKNVWFVGISQTGRYEITEQDASDVTEEEARDALALIGGKLITVHDNGCYDAELPKCLHDLMEFNGYFELSFDLGDSHYHINSESS